MAEVRHNADKHYLLNHGTAYSLYTNSVYREKWSQLVEHFGVMENM